MVRDNIWGVVSLRIVRLMGLKLNSMVREGVTKAFGDAQRIKRFWVTSKDEIDLMIINNKRELRKKKKYY